MKHSVVRRILEKPAKAGVLLYETGEDGKRRFLVPYNEGRFAKNGRYLVLPKGSVDYPKKDNSYAANDNAPKFDSSPIAGGIRETSEETGFPLDKVLGEDNIRLLEQGRTLSNITHPDYPGFEILEASPKAYPHVYDARGGKEQTMVMYGFKVKGLDTLVPTLKNGTGKTTKEYLDERPDMPRFPTFLQWMKQGYIPARNGLPKVELFSKPDWFDKTVKRLALGGIEVPDDWQATRENWQAFCASLDAKDHKHEHAKFRECFSLIKEQMKQEGWIKGDLDVLKFDEKDCPLFYYTEGAIVENEDKIIRQTFSDMIANPDYARAFGGKGTLKKGLNDAQTMVLGQVAAYGSFVKPSIWRGALLEATGHTGKLAQGLIEHGHRIRKNAATLTPSLASGQIAR